MRIIKQVNWDNVSLNEDGSLTPGGVVKELEICCDRCHKVINEKSSFYPNEGVMVALPKRMVELCNACLYAAVLQTYPELNQSE